MRHLPSSADVIVIGAGTAGLAAANSLRLAGVEAIVLEAAGHIGGRCVTDKTTFSTPFDVGGSWLHSAEINPLARLAEQNGKILHKEGWNWSRVHASGHALSPEQVVEYRNYIARMWQAINEAGAQASDSTTQSAMPPGRWASTVIHLIPQMVAGNADVTSARDTYNYADAPGDWLVEGGLGAFVRELHSDVPVYLNCPVRKIDYSGTGTLVTTPMGATNARCVIITVSTGVLAAETIEFVPTLPDSKTAAIENLPNGLLNKVAIEFAPEWTGATQGQIADYHSGDTEFCNLLFGFYGTGLAVGFVSGRFAEALEIQGKKAATDYCLEGLRATFGSDVIRYIRRTDETAWKSNVNALGSYSYAKPGTAEARLTLAEPLADRLFFAGEATMQDSFSTVHGAYLSGLRAAAEVLSMQSALSGDTGNKVAS